MALKPETSKSQFLELIQVCIPVVVVVVQGVQGSTDAVETIEQLVFHVRSDAISGGFSHSGQFAFTKRPPFSATPRVRLSVRPSWACSGLASPRLGMVSRAIPQRELPHVSAFTDPRQLYNPAGASLDDVSFPRPALLVNSPLTLSEMTVPKNVCFAPFDPHSCRREGTLASPDMVDIASVNR
ncbi:predicted protein [Histoplasma capsulatum H143]|uniref:Uncharacterized protein n=1 Tax=Ajellomyces capsulatus (strain H143) TaxID=544712 RepID=C6H390_AJECH|nr:predicted protein [Histoplasma capsulatum H143]